MNRFTNVRLVKEGREREDGRETDFDLADLVLEPDDPILLQTANMGDRDDYVPFQSSAAPDLLIATVVQVTGGTESFSLRKPSNWTSVTCIVGCPKRVATEPEGPIVDRWQLTSSCDAYRSRWVGATEPPARPVTVWGPQEWMHDARRCPCVERFEEEHRTGRWPALKERWLLPRQRSLIFSITGTRPKGWYEVHVSENGVLKRRLHVMPSPPQAPAKTDLPDTEDRTG